MFNSSFTLEGAKTRQNDLRREAELYRLAQVVKGRRAAPATLHMAAVQAKGAARSAPTQGGAATALLQKRWRVQLGNVLIGWGLRVRGVRQPVMLLDMCDR